MSAIEHLLPWTQQPQEAARLRPEYADAVVYLPSVNPGALLNGAALTQGAPLAITNGGIAVAQQQRAKVNHSVMKLPNSAPNVTMFMLVANGAAYNNTASDRWCLGVDSGGTFLGYQSWLGGLTFTASVYYSPDYSGAIFCNATNAVRPGRVQCVVATYVRNDMLRIYVDGTLYGSVAAGNYDCGLNPGGANAWAAGNSTTPLTGSLLCGGVMTRALSDTDARDLSLRGFGALFEPRRIPVPVSAGGGGSWSVSLTETASANDSLAAATTALVSLIESASAADIIGAATIAAVALTEAASASDTQTASYSVTGSGSVTESASASDTLTAANTMLLSLTEAASASDTQTASYSATGSGSVTESASATDTLDAANTMLRALTETASADDQLAAATTMLRAISESASAVDTPAASYSGAGTATIEELTSATDALTAAATLLVTILEAGSATDALAAATTMVRAITEQAMAIDTVAGALPGSTWDVSIEELAAAVDLIAGYAAGGLTVSPLGLRLSAGGRSARLSTTARPPRLSTRTR